MSTGKRTLDAIHSRRRASRLSFNSRSCSDEHRLFADGAPWTKAETKIDRATAFLGLFLFLFATRAITFAKEDSMRLKFYGTRGSIPICDAVFSNSAATPPACKSRSPIRTASPSLTRARDYEIWAETSAPSATSRNKSSSRSRTFTGTTSRAFRSLPRLMIPARKSRF